MRAWLFRIVRNTWFDRLSRRGALTGAVPLDAERDDPPDDALDPEVRLLQLEVQQHSVTRVRTALEHLPVDFREVIVLREVEGLPYKEIAAILGIPIGTVMSRLARARARLLATLELSAPINARRSVARQS